MTGVTGRASFHAAAFLIKSAPESRTAPPPVAPSSGIGGFGSGGVTVAFFDDRLVDERAKRRRPAATAGGASVEQSLHFVWQNEAKPGHGCGASPAKPKVAANYFVLTLIKCGARHL